MAITEAELNEIEMEHRNQTQLEPAHDYSLQLVAEVRRLSRENEALRAAIQPVDYR